MFKPKIFIGSAKETIDLAHDVQQSLDEFAEITVWDQDVFFPSKATMEALERMVKKVDFAIFIFTPTDMLKLRGNDYTAARDNVVLELGLFAGHLGIERCFIIRPRSEQNFHFPTDLLGLMQCAYESNRSDNNMVAAIGTACNLIKKSVINLGRHIYNEVFTLEENIKKAFPPLTKSYILAGLWLSRFDFVAERKDKYTTGIQFDIENLTVVSDNSLLGSNLSGSIKVGTPYRHILRMQIVGNYLLGQWYNTNSNNLGVFQLHIDTHNATMEGRHLGNDNNNNIQTGTWKWLKLDLSKRPLTDEQLKNVVMKSTALLDKKFMRWFDRGLALPVDEIVT